MVLGELGTEASKSQKLNARYSLKTVGSAGNKTLIYLSMKTLRQREAHQEPKEVQVEEIKLNLNQQTRSDLGAS